MRRIAISNQKGGVGKTTTAVNLAAALARAGRRVCLLDLDPQAHATTHLGGAADTQSPSMYDLLTGQKPFSEVLKQIDERLWLIGSDINLAAADVEHLPGDPTRLLGGQEHDRVRHVVRPPDPTERRLRGDGSLKLGRDPAGLDRPERDHVDGDPERPELVGGMFSPSDESGDALKFRQSIAEHAARVGVRFRYGCSVERLEVEHGRVASVIVHDAHEGAEEAVTADAYVVALGSYSPLVLKPIGLAIPVQPVKGYSITIPLEEGDEAPLESLTDEAAKIVFSRLGHRLRVAGTAELAGYDTEVNAARCEALVRRTFALFPRAGHPERAEHWTGLRPATPSNRPLIGRTRFPNLFLNTGHGTLGWTLACGSARALADIVSGRRPEPKFRFLGDSERSSDALLETAPRSG